MSPRPQPLGFLQPTDGFIHRHVGPDASEVGAMLDVLELGSVEELVSETIPAGIRAKAPLDLGPERGEHELLRELAGVASKNEVYRSYIGMGYHGTIVPAVIQRNVLENPGWYTQYTPYQAEISQGRLEALLDFQTMVSDLTGLPLSNASLLDEATAAAEAMHMCHAVARGKRSGFFVSDQCHPQTIDVIATRAHYAGIEIVKGDWETFDFEANPVCGALVQYPTSEGRVVDYVEFAERAHAAKALLVVAADLLSLALLRPPGEFGADVAIGSSQRFGVPMGYGGPHAAFLATREEHKRLIPGRIIGVSRDAGGKPALRMAMQTREQHIRRDKATSNICTAQVLLAIMAGMYGVYHGPEGLRAIATRVHGMTELLARAARDLGVDVADGPVFDTLRFDVASAEEVHRRADSRRINLRPLTDTSVGVALDETVELADLRDVLWALAGEAAEGIDLEALATQVHTSPPEPHARRSDYLEHEVFNRYHPEHEMLRYLQRLQARDLSLTTSMIALGSCTMKLNATTEMLPVTWREFAHMHPFAPVEQAAGYRELFERLESDLCEITGFDAVSLQPNAGSQGEYTGLLVIRAWHEARGESHRDVCLIPVSAHGTNPASAVMAGMKVVAVACDAQGNVDLSDLEAKAEKHAGDLAALMVTYPSTHGVFEKEIERICEVVHAHGGQVYMDGANMNAQVGLCRPGDYGADVCHLNLHKTFCIPHGGGGPGMGPIGVAKHLAPFLPGHSLVKVGGDQSVGAIAAAPWGSPSILTISFVYIELMGGEGLKHATEIAILNANYMARRLAESYPVLYTGARGRVGHEFILDFRPFEKTADITVEDVAKRLMDYGFHAPTMSFPVAGTMMIEPTESETKAELDRLCDALISIREEIRAVEEGRLPHGDNPLENAPHTAEAIASDDWSHPYSREQAAFPAPWVREHKYWPPVARVDNGWGDKNLLCTCPPVEAYVDDPVVEEETVASARG